MDRLKRTDEGFTLLELVIAIALSAVLLLAASNLLINFGRFSSNVFKSESSLMGTALGSFEEIVKMITSANGVAIPADGAAIDVPNTSYPAGCALDRTCIQIRLDTLQAAGGGLPIRYTPSIFSDDTVYTYYLEGGQLKYRTKVGAAAESAATVIANDIFSLAFTKIAGSNNAVNVVLEARAASGPKGQMSREHLETTAVMRSRSAN